MSKIEVNTVDVQCGSTLTLGSAGKTVTIASGASTSGMGRTGTVDWQTTVKTSGFTAVSGEGYFCNTAGGTFEMDLPAGSAGADGTNGANGSSAYEIWIAAGNSGTESEFLTSLVGAQGEQGIQGTQGETGSQGIQG